MDENNIQTNTYCFPVKRVSYAYQTITKSPNPKSWFIARTKQNTILSSLSVPSTVASITSDEGSELRLYLFSWNPPTTTLHDLIEGAESQVRNVIGTQFQYGELLLDELLHDDHHLNDLYHFFIEAVQNLLSFRLRKELDLPTLGPFNLFPQSSELPEKRYMPIHVSCYWMSGHLFFQPRMIHSATFENISESLLETVKEPITVYLAPVGTEAILLDAKQKPIPAMRKHHWTMCRCERTLLIQLAIKKDHISDATLDQSNDIITYPLCCLYRIVQNDDSSLEANTDLSREYPIPFSSCQSALINDELIHATLKGIDIPETFELYSELDRVLDKNVTLASTPVGGPPQTTILGKDLTKESSLKSPTTFTNFAEIIDSGMASIQRAKMIPTSTTGLISSSNSTAGPTGGTSISGANGGTTSSRVTSKKDANHKETVATAKTTTTGSHGKSNTNAANMKATKSNVSDNPGARLMSPALGETSPLLKQDSSNAVYNELDFSVDQVGNIGDLGGLNLDEVDMTDFDFFGGGAGGTASSAAKTPASTPQTQQPGQNAAQFSAASTPFNSGLNTISENGAEPMAFSPPTVGSIAQSSPAAYVGMETPLPATPFDMVFSPRGGQVGTDMMSPAFQSPPAGGDYMTMESPSAAGIGILNGASAPIASTDPSASFVQSPAEITLGHVVSPPNQSLSQQGGSLDASTENQSPARTIITRDVLVEAEAYRPVPSLFVASPSSPSSSPIDAPEEVSRKAEWDQEELKWHLAPQQWLPFRIKQGSPFSDVLEPESNGFRNRYGSKGKWSYEPVDQQARNISCTNESNRQMAGSIQLTTSSGTWTGNEVLGALDRNSSLHSSNTALRKEIRGLLCTCSSTLPSGVQSVGLLDKLHSHQLSDQFLDTTLIVSPCAKIYHFFLIKEAFEKVFEPLLLDTASTPSSSKSAVSGKQNRWLTLNDYLEIQDPSTTVATYGSFQVKKKKRGTELPTELMLPPRFVAKCQGIPISLFEWSQRFWDKLGCEPLFGPKSVEYIALVPTIKGNEARVSILEAVRAFLKDVSGTWSTNRFGKLALMYVNERSCFVPIDIPSLNITQAELEAAYSHWITQVFTVAASSKLRTINPMNQFMSIFLFVPAQNLDRARLCQHVQSTVDDLLVRTGFSYLKGSCVVKTIDMSMVTHSSYHLDSLRHFAVSLYNDCSPSLFDENSLMSMPISSPVLGGIPTIEEPYLDMAVQNELPQTSVMMPERIIFLTWDYRTRSSVWSDAAGLLSHAVNLNATDSTDTEFLEMIWSYFVEWCQAQGVVYHVVLLPTIGSRKQKPSSAQNPYLNGSICYSVELWQSVMLRYIDFVSSETATAFGQNHQQQRHTPVSRNHAKRARIEKKCPVASVCFFQLSLGSDLELYSLPNNNNNSQTLAATGSSGNSPVDGASSLVTDLAIEKNQQATTNPALLKVASALYGPSGEGWIPDSPVSYVVALAHHRRPRSRNGGLFPLATGWLVDMHPPGETGPGVSPYVAQQGDLFWHLVLSPQGSVRKCRIRSFVPWYTQSSVSSAGSASSSSATSPLSISSLNHNYFVMCKQILRDLYRAKSHKSFLSSFS